MSYMAYTSEGFKDAVFARSLTTFEGDQYTCAQWTVTVTARPFPVGHSRASSSAPLLCIEVMADLPWRLPNKVHITMYADDICTWTSGMQLPALQQRLHDATDCTASLLSERAMDMSVEKAVLLPFIRKKNGDLSTPSCPTGT